MDGRMVMAALVVAGFAPVAMAQGGRASPDYDFAYRYPAQAARITPLKAWLVADEAKLRAKTAADAASFRRQSRRDGFPFRKYEASKTWQVVADTDRFLSLSVSDYRYSGGAHGSTGSGGLLWDKRAGRRLDPKSVFVSVPALQAAVTTGWCGWLKRERIRRLGSTSNPGDSFGQCPGVGDLTVLLGSSNGRAFDRIGLIADQYVAGSYAEGKYETTLPVTPAVLRAVKPEYRGAFTAPKTLIHHR